MARQQPDDALAFGAGGSRDADDFYDFLSSSSSSEGEGDDERGHSAAHDVRVTGDVAALASVPVEKSAAAAGSSVFTSARSARRSKRQQRPTAEELAQLAGGAASLAGGRAQRVAPEALAQHATRKSQLESALDALSLTQASSSMSSGAAAGEAPFRFRAQTSSADVETAAVGSESAARTSAAGSTSAAKKARAPAPVKSDGADPLYDDGMDDADEKWVQRNFRGAGTSETDATLCCPCCFMTVCMDCQRHTTYVNQFRASVAVNCRVKKDEILTYSSGAATQSSLPFQKRVNAAAAARTTASGDSLSLLSSANEFYPVVCSDCGTTVGVLDRQQQFHFFNVLPSNC